MSQRKKLNRINEPDYHVEMKSAKITFDGKQFLVRIPNEIAMMKKMKKGDLLQFKIQIPTEPTPVEDGELTIGYVRHDGKD